MWNKVLAIINIICGVIAACYIGGYYFFCGGIRDIINSIIIIGGTCTIENVPLILGCLKLAVANAVFTFILFVAFGMGTRMWMDAQTPN
jgi:hypothetical protein